MSNANSQSWAYTSCILIPPPFHFLKDTPPSPSTQSLCICPLLGRESLMHNLRFRVLCLPQLYCTTHRIRMNWGQSGRRGLAVDLFLGDHQNHAFSSCSCPDFMHVASHQDEWEGSGGGFLMSAIQVHSKKAACGVASGGVNPAYNNRLLEGKTLVLRSSGDESVCF